VIYIEVCEAKPARLNLREKMVTVLMYFGDNFKWIAS